MKILFAIQGTGNGHLSRARDVYPELAKYGEVDVLISGIQADVDFPYPVKYRFYGMSFIFGKKGGVDIWLTTKKLKLFKLIRDIRRLPVEDYDLVINDFEPVSSWACRLKKKPCIGLSHQSAVLHDKAPKPKVFDVKGKIILKHYAPVTAYYGFHFKHYPPNIFTPVIRKQIREISTSDQGHYTVYLPAYDDDTMVAHLSAFPDTKWQIFSKHNKTPFVHQNISVQPIENDAFIQSMASSAGVLCGAGFEGPAEALYLRKKLLAVPMKEQYEQQCNAAGLEDLGVPVIKELSKEYYPQIKEWIESGKIIPVHYPDETAKIIRQLVTEHSNYAAAATPGLAAV